MKNVLKHHKLLVMLLVSFLTLSCDDDDDDYANPGPVQQTIVETAVATPDLSNLVAALQAADGNLVDVLNGGEFTVLAPTNTAFAAFLSDNGFDSLDDVPTDVLSNILLNHVIDGTVGSGDLVAAGVGYTSTKATNTDGDNLSLYFNTSDGVKFNGIADVTTADISTSNGVVHIIDAVIGLPTVVTFATVDPSFETLVAALTDERHTTDYVSLLSSDTSAPFTVFAPTNAAFGDLLTFLGASGLGDIDIDILALTLNTHVVAEANVRSSDLTDDMLVSTLGDDLVVGLNPNQLTDENGRVANIVAVDVQAYNGVVHVIDQVVLPNLGED